MWRTCVVVASVIALVLVHAACSQAQGRGRVNPEGTWDITEGESLEGTPYSGTTEVEAVGDAYTVLWEIEGSGETYTGVALLRGNHLFVGWGPNVGIAIYEIGDDGTLEGEWTIPDAGGEVGTEDCSGGRRGRLEGDYDLSGTNPGGGGSYDGTLSISRNGEVYDVTWGGNAGPASGVGIRVDDILAVGYGPEGGAIAVYEIDGDTADGQWSVSGADTVAVENWGR